LASSIAATGLASAGAADAEPLGVIVGVLLIELVSVHTVGGGHLDGLWWPVSAVVLTALLLVAFSPLAMRDTIALTASTRTVGADPCVLRRPLVAVLAVRAKMPSAVLKVCEWLHVFGIAARGVLTVVMQVSAFGNGPDEQQIDRDMSGRLDAGNRSFSVTLRRSVASPFPAAIRLLFNVAQQSGLRS
jgi:hypothetical protein